MQRLAEARLVQGSQVKGLREMGLRPSARRDAGSSALAAALFQVKLGSVLCLTQHRQPRQQVRSQGGNPPLKACPRPNNIELHGAALR